jgi:hypothetical protein
VDPAARLRHALPELYAFWAGTAQMMSSVLRDHERAPGRAGTGAVAFMVRATETLRAVWVVERRERKQLLAAIGHAVDFWTWRSLVSDEGLGNAAAAELMIDLVPLAQQPLGR